MTRRTSGQTRLSGRLSVALIRQPAPRLPRRLLACRMEPPVSTPNQMAPAPGSAVAASGQPFQKSGWLLDSACLALLVGAGAVLRFFHLDSKPFWFDEGVSVAIARLDWYNLVRLLWRREANMSLYYLLLRGWLHLGSSEAFVRSLSVIAALATIPIVYWLGRQLLDRRAGLIAATLLTFNAYHIRYSQEARSYTLYLFLTALSVAYFSASLRESSARNRRGHVLSSTLALYAHFYAGLIIVLEWLWLRLREPQSVPVTVQKSFSRIAILISPAILFAATTGIGPLSWLPKPGLKETLDFYKHLAGNGGGPLLTLYVAAIAAALYPVLSPIEGKGATSSATLWPRIATSFRRPDRWPLLCLLMWLLLPIAVAILSVIRPAFLARYFILCLPPLLLLASAGIRRVRSPWLTAAILALFGALSIRGAMAYYKTDFDLTRDDYRAASNYVLEHSRPGDVIFFHIAAGRMPYEYYRSLSISTSPPAVIFPSHGDRVDYRDFLGKPSPEFLQTVPQNYKRVWIVLQHNQGNDGRDPTTRLIDETFGQAYPHESDMNFPGVEVRLYER
jgi:mannosyltransferase